MEELLNNTKTEITQFSIDFLNYSSLITKKNGCFNIVHITKYQYNWPIKESINEIKLFPHNFENQDVLNFSFRSQKSRGRISRITTEIAVILSWRHTQN
jgi:hypothetical protein